MSEYYFDLKHKLEELGYNYSLPFEAVSLVDCLLGDLLQTTRSLQHYMDLSQEVIKERDALIADLEPYKQDNSRLLQANNQLHREIMETREESEKYVKELKRKIKSLTEEITKKDQTVNKLQHNYRDLSLRSLCAGTQSSKIKNRRKESGDYSKKCDCRHDLNENNDLMELVKRQHDLEEQYREVCDEVVLLKKQVENRDEEIVRLNMLVSIGKPPIRQRETSGTNIDPKLQDLIKQISDLQSANENLKAEIENGLQKQHEAMLRALDLADKNQNLQDEMHKVDSLALKVEEDCNKKLSTMMNEIEELQNKNTALERELMKKNNYGNASEAAIKNALQEKEALQKEVNDLLNLNKSLQDKVISLSESNKDYYSKNIQSERNSAKFATKDDLHSLLVSERKMYEKHLNGIQKQLTETLCLFNSHISICKPSSRYNPSPSPNTALLRDLQNKLCESEQKILMLKKENEELKSKEIQEEVSCKENYNDIVKHLNIENSELSKENIQLCQQISHYKNLCSEKQYDRGDFLRKDLKSLQEEVERLSRENKLLQKDKQEYNQRYKDAALQLEKLRHDLILKQQQIELVQDENNSYKITNRTGRASTDRLKEECDFLKAQIKTMHSSIIKEKSMASQIKQMQIETERSTNEKHNEILQLEKQLTFANNNIERLEKQCSDLNNDLKRLRKEKDNLIDNIKTLDHERDKLVLELDNKTELLSAFDKKIQSQTYELSRLEMGNNELIRKLNANRGLEQKTDEYETQNIFLSGEVAKLQQMYDSALIENKRLQNELADITNTQRISRIEYEKSVHEVEALKQQLQHYVDEIRRIEDMLSQKEAERSDMLEHFASLSVEANILENTNQSLESESASKSMQLQSYVTKIQHLETQLSEKEHEIETQKTKIASLTCKVSNLQSEVKLVTEEKKVFEHNIARLKKMCNDLQDGQKATCSVDSEIQLYESKIKNLTSIKCKLESEKLELMEKLASTEKLLSNARREIIDLKLALQDATSETKSLHERISRLSTIESEDERESTLQRSSGRPLTSDEVPISNTDEDDSPRYLEFRKRISKFTHGSTL